ncbi:MAG: hypothetical protein IPK39_11735 [Sulfuritalea sp.]|nr:hypothetical protein [Sulfuritalea sp.]
MTRNEILQAFDRMRVWQRGDQRAVHKPLLVLFALARVGAGGTATMDWNEAEPHLKELLEEFGRMDQATPVTILSGICRQMACGNWKARRPFLPAPLQLRPL